MDAPIISFKWNNSDDFLEVNTQGVGFYINKKSTLVSFSSLLSIKLESKKKLGPLITGAVLTSLAMVNILLEGAGLSMISVFSIGMLILYFGLSDYWVLTIHQFKESQAFWISKNKCLTFPKTLINIIDYRVSKGFFPPFYAIIKKNSIEKYVGNPAALYQLEYPLAYYLTPPTQGSNMLLLKVDLEKLHQTLTYEINQSHLAIGTLQINKDAIINT